MPPTPPAPLARANYLSTPPGPYNANADPNNPSFDPTLVLPAGGYVSYGDAALDAEQYQRPLERLHGMGLHAPGVAFGMQIACTTGHPKVTILPGLALDAAGRHIYLAVGGSAEISPTASDPSTPPHLAAVTAAGVTLPTTGNVGTWYVVAQWWETWDSAGYASDPNIGEYSDTPWLQLVSPMDGTYDPTVQVVLGEVELDGSSNVTSASYGDVGGIQRTSVSLPAQSLQLNRAVTTAAPGADTAAWAEVRAREAGGIEIAVANNSDQITVLSDAGGNFTTFAVGADLATVGDLANPGINLNGSEATVQVGAPGNYGDVLVYDGNSHLAVSLIGDTAHVIVGGDTLAGEVRMFNANASETMTLQGSLGAAVVQQLNAYPNGQSSTIDVNAQKVHIHGWDLCLDGRSQTNGTPNSRALVDGGNKLIVNYNGDYGNGVEIQSNLQVDDNVNLNGVLSAQGTPLMGNPARKVQWCYMFAGSVAGDPTRVTAEVDLGSQRQLTAYSSITSIDSTSDFDYDNGLSVEVYMVDGVTTSNGWIYGAGSKWGSQGSDTNAHQPLWTGTGQVITFRLASLGPDLTASAIGIVFYE